MVELKNPTFEEWIIHVFDHPVANPQWYFDLDADLYFCDKTPIQCAEYIKALLTDPMKHTRAYTDAQINQGIYMLVDATEGYMQTLFDSKIPLQLRLDTIHSMYDVFEKLFAIRCTPHLSHLFRTTDDVSKANPLNAVCYMWWDIIPFYAKSGDANREILDMPCIDVMEKALQLESMACQESALHGLGHWQHEYPERIHPIIDDFLSRSNDIHPDLKQYALSARSGYIL